MPACGNKKFRVFINRVIIRHARDIVADGALHAVERQLGKKIFRQRLGVADVVFIEPLEHIFGLALLALGHRIPVGT